MQEDLKYIYDDIYRWLIFAEAKNGALLTFITAVMGIILSNGIKVLGDFFGGCLIILCLIIIVITTSSFIPFLSDSFLARKMAYKTYRKKSSDNIIFYINLFLIDCKENMSYGDDGEAQTLEKFICIRFGREVTQLTEFEKSIISQIRGCARVTSIKYAFFDAAMKVFTVLICFIMMSVLLCA